MHAFLKKGIASIIITTIVLFSSAPFAAGASNSDPEKYAFIFGCIDTYSIKGYLDGLSFMSYPPKMKLYSGLFPRDIAMTDIYTNGLFFSDKVKPGQYWLAAFQVKKPGFTSGNGITNCNINWGRPSPEELITLEAGEIYYWGSYQYIEIKEGLFSKTQFTLQKIDSPGEKELLEQILDSKYIKGSKWESKIRERLEKIQSQPVNKE